MWENQGGKYSVGREPEGDGLKVGAIQDVLDWDIFIKPTTLYNG